MSRWKRFVVGAAALSVAPLLAGDPDPLEKEIAEAVRPPALPGDPPKPVPAAPAPPTTPVVRDTAPGEKPPTILIPGREPAARLLEPLAVGSSMDYAAVERARRGDRRFARLTFDLRDGRVVIAGSAADPADAWELARKIAPHVGGKDVVVGRIRQ
jgi:hypothetical protein